ncbi:hypothetical protein AVEN_168820-1 [Araneus ventricosus]|uniref:Uncharacterized protein n=1 Tax=Araneus ventricosus TaxID=182803 RepID=A0A4Y2P4G0_ARAVE|nr:hypothetical protein AVEN_168820-1 [Araneus ventricosus]
MTTSSSKGAGRIARSCLSTSNDDNSSSNGSWKNSEGHAFDFQTMTNSSSKGAGRIRKVMLSDFQTMTNSSSKGAGRIARSCFDLNDDYTVRRKELEE